MLKKFALTTFFVMCCASLLAKAEETKHYCTPTDIEINDSMILIHLEDKTFETDTLLTDQGGVYVLTNALRCPECRKSLNPKNTCEYHPDFQWAG